MPEGDELERDDTVIDENMQQHQADAGHLKCTFEVSVRATKNATWQGQIHWANTNRKQHFRSVLEMLTLMAEALMEIEGDLGQVGWERCENASPVTGDA